MPNLPVIVSILALVATFGLAVWKELKGKPRLSKAQQRAIASVALKRRDRIGAVRVQGEGSGGDALGFGKRVSQGRDGVRQAARERKQERFTALLHHVTINLLRDSFYALKRQAAPAGRADK
jgi:hypothetical protein